LLYITSCFHSSPFFSPNRKKLFPFNSHSSLLIFSYQANSRIRLYIFPSSNKMKHSCLHFNWILLIFFHGILLLKSARILSFADETDRLGLLDFKKRISEDPLQIMSSWNDSTHFCNWFGVTCSPSNKRVVVLNLEAQRLAGYITPSMGNLTCLTGINLGNNSIYGEIPQEMGSLRRLQHLKLSFNSFGGNLPTNLSHCTQLRVLHVGYNKLVGQIPEQFSSLSKLVYLNLGKNNLTGIKYPSVDRKHVFFVFSFPYLERSTREHT
jgi:hypothetical protein